MGPLGGRTIHLGSLSFIQQNRNLSHNSFFLVSLKISLFFPGKHKKGYVPEELPGTSDLQLHPGEEPTGFLPAASGPGVWGLQEAQGNIENKSRALNLLLFSYFYSLFCHAVIWILGMRNCWVLLLPSQGRGLSGTLGMRQEGHGGAEFPKNEQLLVVSCMARG